MNHGESMTWLKLTPKHPWRGEDLAKCICDLLYGRTGTPLAEPEKGKDYFNVCIEANDVWLRPHREDPSSWELQFRYGGQDWQPAFREYLTAKYHFTVTEF